MRHHVIISGTGRAGTTLLVQLFTRLGLDTGWRDASDGIYANCHAGMELDLSDPRAPYIVKNPRLCDDLAPLLDRGEVAIDHAYVPVRDLRSAAESRRNVTRRAGEAGRATEVPGGLWLTSDPSAQESILAGQLYKLIYALARHEVPLTLLHFPRFSNDPEYLYRSAAAALKGVSYADFLAAYSEVVRPHLINDFRVAG